MHPPAQQTQRNPYEGPLRDKNATGVAPQAVQHDTNDQNLFPGNCWTCDVYGHASCTCNKPGGEMLERNLTAYSERSQMSQVDTSNNRDAQLEILGADEEQVTGCLDSGADGNVAFSSMADHALNVGTMRFCLNHRLPTNESVHPSAHGYLKN